MYLVTRKQKEHYAMTTTTAIQETPSAKCSPSTLKQALQQMYQMDRRSYQESDQVLTIGSPEDCRDLRVAQLLICPKLQYIELFEGKTSVLNLYKPGMSFEAVAKMLDSFYQGESIAIQLVEYSQNARQAVIQGSFTH